MKKGEKAMRRVLVSGYYGFGNAGDEAILMAIVESLKKIDKDILITALSANPETTKKFHKINAIQRTNPLAIIREIIKADLVISGGGGLLQDVTSSRSIPYYLLIVYLAKKLGKRVMFYANGVGPVYRNLNKQMIKKVANTVDLITVRDEESKKQLENLGVEKPSIIVTADPAFVLKPIDDNEGQRLLENQNIQLDDNRLKVGVSVRPWNLSKSRKTIAKTCDYLSKTFDAQIVFLPMQFPKDYEESMEIVKNMKKNAKVLKQPMGPKELLWLSGKMDLIFGMRLHALIFGAMMKVPLMGIVYDPKVRHFLERVDQPSAGTPEELDLANTCLKLENIIQNIDTQKRILSDKKKELTRLSFENAKLAFNLLGERKW